MRDPRDWVDLLSATGALLDGHFLLSSGRHSTRYVQCARALEHPENATAMGRALAQRIDGPVDRVVAPPLGGLLIGYEVARHLKVPFSFPERDPTGKLALRRGFEFHSGERICLIEDVITTGRTTIETIHLIEQLGAIPTALGAIVDRSAEHGVNGLPIRSLLRLEIPTFEPEACPACTSGISLTKPGSRAMTQEDRP